MTHGRDIEDASRKLISVVVPVFCEEKSIDPFLNRIVPVLEAIGPYEIIFCLDPCPDNTKKTIEAAAAKNPSIAMLLFARRIGQPAATMAGILNSSGDWCVLIDVDLQDPPEFIANLYQKAQEGYDVVAAKRRNRKGENLVKKLVSYLGYMIINKIADVKIPVNTGDFRIISRRVIEGLRKLREKHGFLRGLVPLVGYPQCEIIYDRDDRLIGTGKYSKITGSLTIGFNGIIGFSTTPLKLMLWIGLGISFISAILSILIIILKFYFDFKYPMGIPTITIAILFFGGVQLASIGVLGEYVGRIYEEVRDRPLYTVMEALNIEVR